MYAYASFVCEWYITSAIIRSIWESGEEPKYGSCGSHNLAIPSACREGKYHLESFQLWAFIFIIHLREPSVIVQRQILCRNTPDVMIGNTQYFRVTAVSGCPADVLRADVNLLFMSIPWEGIHFYLRLKSGSASAKRQLSSSLRVNQQLQGHPRVKDTALSCLSVQSPSWSWPHTNLVFLLWCLWTDCISNAG